jgi:hypothetical protein
VFEYDRAVQSSKGAVKMPRALGSMIALLSASAMLAGSAVAVAHQPVARTAGSCSVGTGHGFGYTYLVTLSVRGTNCATGKSVAKRHGRVSGWSCGKKRLQTSPVQYDDRETCTSGSRRVQWTFTQNT